MLCVAAVHLPVFASDRTASKVSAVMLAESSSLRPFTLAVVRSSCIDSSIAATWLASRTGARCLPLTDAFASNSGTAGPPRPWMLVRVIQVIAESRAGCAGTHTGIAAGGISD